MKKIEKWEHKDWFRAIIFSIVLFLVGAILTVLFLYCFGIISFDWKVSVEGLLRVLILGSGAIAGLYALRLAIDRQEKFSNQVDVQTAQMQVQADQTFNDRLGRGVELLADEKNVVMRSAGVSILVDLANNANEAQKPIVASIIYDFFRNRLAMRSDNDFISNHQDTQNALDFLINLPLNEREKLLPNRLVGDKLDFSYLDFSFFNFIGETLENINFTKAKMNNTNFSYATIKNVDFSHARIEGEANFSYTKIENSIFGMECEGYAVQKVVGSIPPKDTIHNCDFSYAEMKNTTFCNMNIESTNFSYISLLGGGFRDVEFWRGDFCFKNPEQPMGISSDSDLPHFIGTDLGDSEFQFANVLDSNKFFEFCYAPMDEERGGITTFIDESRAYNTIDLRIKIFIKSNEDWSEQPVTDWVAVEIAQWKLEQAQSLSSPFGDADADAIIDAQAELENAIRDLDYAQDVLGLPPKIPKPKAKKPKAKPKTP